MLVGRDPELTRIRSLVDGLGEGSGGALVIHGQAGIGKTALLEAARAMAASATVLAGSGIEFESELPFSALRDLVGPVIEERERLPASQREALAGALALGPPAPGDRLAVCVATLGVLEAAATQAPVLALLDDVQWLDRASFECVVFAARRVRGPIAFLMAARNGHADDGWQGLPSAELGPLAPREAAELLAGTAPDLAPAVRDAVGAAAAGNPLALVELPTTLTDAQRRGSDPLEQPLAPGRELERVYATRLGELPEPTRTALLVAAACHVEELAAVDAACRGLGCSTSALEAAETAGLVSLGDGRLSFRHPLVRGAVYHGALAEERRAVHRALAEVVHGEAHAWHLASAAVAPDEVAAGALEQAAGVAAGRRAYAAAADALERAAALSETAASAVPRLLGGGAAALSAGHTAQAHTLAERAREQAADPLALAGAEHLCGVLALWGGQVVEATTRLEHGADLVAEANPAMAALMLADASFACSATNDCHRSLALSERAVGLIGDILDPAVRAPVCAIHSWNLTLTGDVRRARPIMAEALRLFESLDPCSPAAQLIIISFNCRLPFEDYEGALASGRECAATARESGSRYALPTPLLMAAEASYRLGRWDGLEDLLDESIAAAQETDQWGPAAFAAVSRARLAAARGREQACRADAEQSLELADSAGVQSLAVYAHAALGFLELGQGRAEAAIPELEQTERLALAGGLDEPTLIPWGPDLIEAYVRAGRLEPARRVLGTLARQAELVESAGAAALAERCRGLLAEADFDAYFAHALEHHARRSMPFERARTLLAWGMRLHRARRRADARERIRAALATFEQLGAEPWAHLARAELRAAGGRRRRVVADDALTAQEERVARAAAGGATTREIATELFLSPKTVEFHLGRVYRKLGVHSRAELAGALASGTAERV